MKNEVQDTDHKCVWCSGSLKLRVIKELPEEGFVGQQRYQIVERYHFCGQCGVRYEFPPPEDLNLKTKSHSPGFNQTV